MRKNSLFLILIALVLSLPVSCARTTEKASIGDEVLPEMILYNANYTFGQPDNKPLFLNAGKIVIWENFGKTEIEDISFSQKDDNGEIELTGTCDSAVSYDNKVAELNGNVSIYKKTDSISIKCDSVVWDDEKQLITAEGIVSVTYQDGTEILARGFTAYLDENIYQFEELIEGRYTSEE